MSKTREEQRRSRLAGPLSKKMKFTKKEDLKLKALIEKYTTNDWDEIAKHLPPRTARQCRDRWCNYIDPNLSQEPWTSEEDTVLFKIHKQLGNHWKKMEKYLPKRSKNNIKKRWNFLNNISNKDEEEEVNNKVNNDSDTSNQYDDQLSANSESLVSVPSNLYFSLPNIPQISKPTMLPIVTSGTAAFIPIVPVFIPVVQPIINNTNDYSCTESIPQYYQQIIEQPIESFPQPFYQVNLDPF